MDPARNNNNFAGKVFLIGAGPGDPLLLTLRGAQAIAQADVLVYDRLAHPRVLEHARPGTELVYVGKTSDRHVLEQDEINRFLIERARQGKTVARVKGGDPFVFGRGGEEAEALFEAGIDFEVVSGISSAIAVPAYAGIPVTHRDHTSAVGIVTGHEDPSKGTSALRWEHLAKGLDTLVFLMGVRMPEISERLQEHGRPASTPIAVIEWGTRTEQRTVVATLDTIVDAVEKENIGAPAVIVVGDVVALREKLRWFDNRPLFGKRVVVTRAREQSSDLADKLSALGASVLEFPLISCRPLQDTSLLDSAIVELSRFDWLVFTSSNGVQFFMDRLFELGLDVRALAGLKLGAVGAATAQALEERSLLVDFTPSQFVAESFVAEFPADPEGLRVCLARAEEGREVIPDEFRKQGAEVTVVPCYRTVAGRAESAELRLMLAAGSVDIVTFTSSSTVKNFADLLLHGEFPLPSNVQIASIGPATSETARALGLPVHVEAQEHTITGLVDAIVQLCNAASAPGR